MAPVAAPSTSQPADGKPMNWADEFDEDLAPGEAAHIEERDEGNGVKVVIQYRTNADGNKVKVGSSSPRVLLCLHQSYR